MSTLLDRCEDELGAALGTQAAISRSQAYYLDITHPLANKGDALSEIATLLGAPMAEIAVIGDGANDVAMFERAVSPSPWAMPRRRCSAARMS